MVTEPSEILLETIREIRMEMTMLREGIRELGMAFNTIQIDVVTVKTDVGWLKRFFWVVGVAAIGGFISILVELIR